MRAVDTNVLVRLLVDDEPVQAAAAQQAMSAVPVFVPKTVILEFEWVLRSVYQRPPTVVASAIESLLAAEGISVEDASAVSRAVGWFRQGLDLADALHLASSAHADSFLSFDATMRRRAARHGIKPQVVAP